MSSSLTIPTVLIVLVVSTEDCGSSRMGSSPIKHIIIYGGYGRVVEDACLWNKYIRNARVRIPLATLFLLLRGVVVAQDTLDVLGWVRVLAEE